MGCLSLPETRYAALSDEQKQLADQFIKSSTGIM